MIEQVSKLLFENRIYHKVISNRIITKRSKVTIPCISEDIAYLLGVITGDGTMIKSKRKCGGYYYIVGITANSEKYLVYLNQLFFKKFSAAGKIYKDMRKNTTYNLLIKNAAIFWYFINLGLNIGKKQPKIPKIAQDNEVFLHFLAGLIDTDGHVENNRIQLKQKSKIFLENIYLRLLTLNLSPNLPKVNYTDSKPFYYIRFDNKLPLRWKPL